MLVLKFLEKKFKISLFVSKERFIFALVINKTYYKSNRKDNKNLYYEN